MNYFYVFISQLIFLVHVVGAVSGETPSSSPKITIVGAGLAGLTAAYRLQQLGYAADVYEARNHPGGRVCTAYFESPTGEIVYEELGGKSLNDAGDAEDISALIKEMGLKVISYTNNVRSQMVWEDKVYSFPEVFKKAPRPSALNYRFLQKKVKTLVSLGEMMDVFFGKNKILRQTMEVMMSGYEGSSTHSLSPRYLDISFWDMYERYYQVSHSTLLEKTIMRQQKFVEGGNSRLIHAVADRLKNPIHYNAPLRKIKQTESGYELYFDGKEPVLTDYLILAIPCSTLRDVAIEKGIIPDDQMQAIKTLQYGTNAKILLPIKFKDKPMSEIVVTKNLVSWVNHDHSIMTWYYGGEPGVFNSFSVDTLAQVVDNDISCLQLAYPDLEFCRGLKPTFPSEDTTLVYKQPIGISWFYEEFSKGSYSNYHPDQFDLFHELVEEYGLTVRKVFRSINGKIFFAGEHVALEVPATMEGAVQSGEKAAKGINQAILEENQNLKAA